mgnify:CR=1 FL=1
MPPETLARSARSRFVSIGGSRRHLLEWGEPGAPVVILQHGMRDHAHSWSWLAESLKERYHVIAPDLRGHGDSDWSSDSNYALASFVIDLAAIADLCGLRDFSLVGHSLGGQIALRYTAAFPERVRALLAIEGVELPMIRQEREKPVPYPVRLREWAANEMMRRLQSPSYYPDIARAAARMQEANPEIDAATVAYLTATGVIAEADRGFRWKYDNGCRYRPPEDQRGADLDDMLSSIKCPALLAYGDGSWIAPPPPARLARLAQHRVITFGGASHWLHHQRRPEFNELVGRFLADPSSTLANERDHYA